MASQAGSVRSGHQTVSDYTLRKWFPNSHQSRFLTDRMRLEKLVLPSGFDTSLSSFDYVKPAELSSNSSEWTNVTFWGSKHSSHQRGDMQYCNAYDADHATEYNTRSRLQPDSLVCVNARRRPVSTDKLYSLYTRRGRSLVFFLLRDAILRYAVYAAEMLSLRPSIRLSHLSLRQFIVGKLNF